MRILASCLVLVACSSSSSPAPPGADASASATLPTTPTDAAAEPEAAAPDAGPIVVNGCTIARVSDPDQCAEDCDARLDLPKNGGSFCTVACEKDADCGGMACPSTVGACMPRCTSNGECTGAGFARCDAKTGACDTL